MRDEHLVSLPLMSVLLSLAVGSPAGAACTAGGIPSLNVKETTPTLAFIDHGDGTVTHGLTGLMWKQCVEGMSRGPDPACTGTASSTTTWVQALAAATSANTAVFAGYRDWRVPNKKELESIVEFCGYDPAINQTIFPATPPWAFWTASTWARDPNSTFVWHINFHTGYTNVLSKTELAGWYGYVRLVRGGRSLSSFDALAGGRLKVCKVAGPGIAVGTPSTFTVGSSTLTVPAGPAPGGICVVGPDSPVGSSLTVAETIPAGDTVSSITVAPPGRLASAPNLATGSVDVMIGRGITEVTFTDKRTGFVEICTRGSVSGSFPFTVMPGGSGLFVVPAGACSPAIEIAAGTVMIQELPAPGVVMAGCETIPDNQQGPCNFAAQTSIVTVVPGDVSVGTIAFVTNRPRTPADGTPPSVMPAFGGTTTTLACEPNPARSGSPVTCLARVTPVLRTPITPTGTVSFADGTATLANVQLSPDDATAAFTTTALATGPHAIVASYGGDADFGLSVSEQFTAIVTSP
jgi:hypothetical protein